MKHFTTLGKRRRLRRCRRRYLDSLKAAALLRSHMRGKPPVALDPLRLRDEEFRRQMERDALRDIRRLARMNGVHGSD